MFVARAVAALRPVAALVGSSISFCLSLTKRKASRTILLNPISSSSLQGWQRHVHTSLPPLAPGSPATCRRDVPPHGPQSRKGEVQTVGTVLGRTFEAPTPAHGRVVSPPLLVQPSALADRTCGARLIFCSSTATGGDGPGPIELSFRPCEVEPSEVRDIMRTSSWTQDGRTLTPATASPLVVDWCQAIALTGNGGLTLSTHTRRTLTPATLRLQFHGWSQAWALTVNARLKPCKVRVFDFPFSDASSGPCREKLRGGLLGGFTPVEYDTRNRRVLAALST